MVLAAFPQKKKKTEKKETARGTTTKMNHFCHIPLGALFFPFYMLRAIQPHGCLNGGSKILGTLPLHLHPTLLGQW